MFRKLNKKYIFYIVFILIGLVFSTIGSFVGSGAFLITQNTDINEGLSPEEDSEPVCYIKTTSVYYTSIEKALEVAGSNNISDEIIILPNTNPIIKRDCTIDTRDTLILSIDDNGTRGNWKAADDFYNGGAYHNKAVSFLNTVTINANVTLTNYGILEDYGEIVSAIGGSWGGFPAKNCTRFLLEENSKIVNYGTINAFGYFNESSSNNGSQIICNSGSVLHIPFSIYFRGGTATVALTGGLNLLIKKINNLSYTQIFPFDQYEITNLSSMVKVYSGSYVYAHINFNLDTSIAGDANRKSFTAEINLIGDKNLSNCLFKLSSGSYVNIKYNGLINDHNPIYVDFYGGMTMEEISLTMEISIGITVTRTVNTANYYFPFCHNMNLSLNKLPNQEEATYRFDNLLKFMPGSSLTINEGVTLNTTGTIVFYKDRDSGNISAGYRIGYGDAKLLVLGNLKANNLGGFALTDSNVSSVFIQGNNSISTQEMINNDDSENFNNFTSLTEGYVGDNNTIAELKNPYLYRGNGTYWNSSPLVSIKQKNIESISIVDDSGNEYYDMSDITPGTNVNIKIVFKDIPNKEILINGEDYSSLISGNTFNTQIVSQDAGLSIEAYAGIYTFTLNDIANATYMVTNQDGDTIESGSEIVYGDTLQFTINLNQTNSRIIVNGVEYNYNNTSIETYHMTYTVSDNINLSIYSGIRKLVSDGGDGVSELSYSGNALFNANNDKEILIGRNLHVYVKYDVGGLLTGRKNAYMIITNDGETEVNFSQRDEIWKSIEKDFDIIVKGDVNVNAYKS